jgi:hypothetical protein
MNRNLKFTPLAASCALALLGFTGPAHAADNGVVLSGYNVQYNSMAVSDSALSRDQLCGAEGSATMLNLFNQVGDRLEGRLTQGGISAGERQSEAEAARSELCQSEDSFSVDAYAMTYADCRMTMDTASVLTDISLPPGEASATMSMSDFYRAESSQMTLDRTLEAAGSMASMSMTDVNWTGPGDSKSIAGHSTTRWDFQYEGAMDLGGESMAAMKALGLNATFSNTGHGYYSTTAPGMDIVQAFFDKFANQVGNEGSSSMFGSMLNTMVDMLQKGMPLEMEQTVTTNMGGRSQGMSSKIKATGLRTVTLAGDYCTRNLVPDYFEVTDINQQMEGMNASMGGASGAGAEGVPNMNESMGELNKMMEQMTPEQREAMKGMGLGSMFGGDANKANPAGQPAQAPAGSAPSGSAKSSSADLMTGNMTQSVQMHLQALGYATGNTDGDLSTDTVIAISQFQAENGLEVTGEVTPQLLGILGARVDAQ